MKVARKRIFVSGGVQGVGYRASAYDEATRLGLRGWVRNRRDGRVETVVEGDDDKVQAFVEWSKVGPPSAQVRDVDAKEDADSEDLGVFEVRPTL